MQYRPYVSDSIRILTVNEIENTFSPQLKDRKGVSSLTIELPYEDRLSLPSQTS